MDIEQRSSGGVVIIEAKGDITYGKGSDVVLRTAIDGLLKDGHRHLLLDVGGVNYVDSAGLGQLAQIAANAETHRASLKLVRVGKRLRDLLAATRLLPLFDVFDNEEHALASFGATSSLSHDNTNVS
jgi:anti-sigma B factor antagonist